MKPFKELFEQYIKGVLSEDKIEGMNQQLIAAYFDSAEDLNEDQLVYTEDLVFDLYASNNLDETFSNKLKEKFEKDASLQKKYTLLKSLSYASLSEKEKHLQEAVETETDEQEETQLREVLDEAIAKVYAEKEATTTEPGFDIFLSKLKSFFKELIPPINYTLPQVQLVMISVSIFLIAIIVWITVDPLQMEQMADDTSSDSLNTNQVAVTDSISPDNKIEEQQIAHIETPDPIKEDPPDYTKLQNEKLLREQAKRERLSNLLADNYKTPEFEYTLMRSQTSDATDLFIRAADNYNEGDYDSCSYILNRLLKLKSFKQADTLSEIHFYLGHCYLIKGRMENDTEFVEKSLASFKEVKHKYFIKQGKWYAMLASLELDKKEESIELLDTLVEMNYPENIEVFRDSVFTIISN